MQMERKPTLWRNALLSKRRGSKLRVDGLHVHITKLCDVLGFLFIAIELVADRQRIASVVSNSRSIWLHGLLRDTDNIDTGLDGWEKGKEG